MMSLRWTALLLSALCWVALLCALVALDNGLALTPPMGWNARFAFIGCNTDCTNNPNKCVSDRNTRKMADLMVSEGYLAMGYEYLILEDCWMGGMGQTIRNSTGHLQPDISRFPHGIKTLADYVHSKGLKFGILVTSNSAGRSGDDDSTLKKDTATLAEWGVYYKKVDGSAYTGNSDELARDPYMMRAPVLQTSVKTTPSPRTVWVKPTLKGAPKKLKPKSPILSWKNIAMLYTSILISVTLVVIFLEC